MGSIPTIRKHWDTRSRSVTATAKALLAALGPARAGAELALLPPLPRQRCGDTGHPHTPHKPNSAFCAREPDAVPAVTGCDRCRLSPGSVPSVSRRGELPAARPARPLPRAAGRGGRRPDPTTAVRSAARKRAGTFPGSPRSGRAAVAPAGSQHQPAQRSAAGDRRRVTQPEPPTGALWPGPGSAALPPHRPLGAARTWAQPRARVTAPAPPPGCWG